MIFIMGHLIKYLLLTRKKNVWSQKFKKCCCIYPACLHVETESIRGMGRNKHSISTAVQTGENVSTYSCRLCTIPEAIVVALATIVASTSRLQGKAFRKIIIFRQCYGSRILKENWPIVSGSCFVVLKYSTVLTLNILKY